MACTSAASLEATRKRNLSGTAALCRPSGYDQGRLAGLRASGALGQVPAEV